MGLSGSLPAQFQPQLILCLPLEPQRPVGGGSRRRQVSAEVPAPPLVTSWVTVNKSFNLPVSDGSSTKGCNETHHPTIGGYWKMLQHAVNDALAGSEMVNRAEPPVDTPFLQGQILVPSLRPDSSHLGHE